MTHALSVAVQVRKRQKEEIKDSTNFHPLFFSSSSSSSSPNVLVVKSLSATRRAS